MKEETVTATGEAVASIDAAVVLKIAEHYCHARAKHPYFADRIIDNYGGGPQTRFAVKAMEQELRLMREFVADRIKDEMVKPETLLWCEVSEANLAYAQNEIPYAVEECYDAIAVLLRMVDVLEGRQALGKPKDEGEAAR